MKIFIPIGKRCLIKPYQSADKTTSGIILDNTSNASSAPVRGTVIRAGDTSVFKVGDELYFRRYSIDSLKTVTPEGEVEVSIVEDDDVLGCLVEEPIY